MTNLILLLTVFLTGYAAGRWRVKAIENQGEAAVRRLISKSFNGESQHLLNNVTLPCGNGTTQIDHVFVSKNGIFIIETKHYSGWIFADPALPTWTKVQFKQKYKFQNPIHQNYKHVQTVRKLLEFLPPEAVYSVVVFTGSAEFKTKMPKNVINIDMLVQHIRNHEKDWLSENRVQFCVGRLECQRRFISGQTDIEHQAYLNQKFGDLTK